MIHIADWTDIDHCIALLKEYHAKSAYRIIPFDETRTRETVLDTLANGIILIGPDQILAARKIIPHFSKEPIAAELALFSLAEDTRTRITQEHQLHEAFVYWAKHVAQVQVIQDGAFGKTNYFKKRNYLQAETAYLVRI